MSDTPHLPANPAIAYLPDEFARPAYAFAPDVVIDVGTVLDKVIAMLDCHVSQFYEWLPYNVGLSHDVPKGTAERRNWLAEQVRTRLRSQANRFRQLLLATYGPDKGGRVEFAEKL